MPVDAIGTGPMNATAQTGMYATGAGRAPKQTMDSEVFLSLLVTQLRNQDPSSPMDTNQMISQTAQLASMQQLTGLAELTTESFSLQMRQAASALLGQQASYTDADGHEVTGLVTSVSFRTGLPAITIDGVAVPLDRISQLTTAPAA